MLKLCLNTVYLLIKTNVENFVSEFMLQFLRSLCGFGLFPIQV
jgi:hypothetical protein